MAQCAQQCQLSGDSGSEKSSSPRCSEAQQKFLCAFSATAPDPFSYMVSLGEPTLLQNVLLP